MLSAAALPLGLLFEMVFLTKSNVKSGDQTHQRGRKTQKTVECGKEGKWEVFNLFKKSTKSCHKLAVY